ncbi:MAG: cytochrome c, partial [Myxococcales bacterium]|nr:cytochrome c [Myxococcales bacterium]
TATGLIGETEGDSVEARMKRGAAVFLGTCSTCHMKEGQGLPKVFPPLAKSDYLVADKARAIRGVLAGITGPITVNGEQFNGVMPALANLTDHEIADVLTYVNKSFGNDGEVVTDDEVKAERAKLPKVADPGHP